jgi:pimeloyl-ACP methyl ester carboxylesterase
VAWSEVEFVTAGEVTLFVRRFGDPALPLLIVVHGGPGWDHSYLLPAVADLAHVVLFDLRGCGRSSRLPPAAELSASALQPDLLADDVAALIRHYGAERADILGFSYGGRVAMRVVDQHPALVRSIILASTTAYEDYERERDASIASTSGTRSWRGSGSAATGMLRTTAASSGPAPRRTPRTCSGTGAAHSDPARPPGMSFPVSLARRLHAAAPASRLTEIPAAAHMAHFDNPQA